MALSDTTAPNYELRDPDVRLMLQVRDDNAAAFEELVLRYQGRLMTVLEQLVQKRDVAEDLAQEVFMRVFRARKTYQPGAKFSTWLFTIANNVASNALRSLGASARSECVAAQRPRRSSRSVGPDGIGGEWIDAHAAAGPIRASGDCATGDSVAE